MKSRRRRRRSSCFVQRHRLSIPLLKGAERGGDEAVEAGGEAAEALPDEDDERPGDAALCALPRDMGAERFDEGVEAGEEQKTGGCGGWGGHGCKSPMRGWGWASRSQLPSRHSLSAHEPPCSLVSRLQFLHLSN